MSEFPKKIPAPDSPLRKLFDYPDGPVPHISPTETKTAYETYEALAFVHRVERVYGLALMVIRDGCADPASVAARALNAVCETAQKPSETLEDALYANCKPGEGFDGPQGAE